MRRRSRKIMKPIADTESLSTANSKSLLITLSFLKGIYQVIPKGPNLFIFSRTNFEERPPLYIKANEIDSWCGVVKPIAGTESLSTPPANTLSFLKSVYQFIPKGPNLFIFSSTSKNPCQAIETRSLPLYIKANEIDNRRGVTLDTTYETLDIHLNKICENT